MASRFSQTMREITAPCGVCGNGRESAPRDGRGGAPADILGRDGEVNAPPEIRHPEYAYFCEMTKFTTAVSPAGTVTARSQVFGSLKIAR